MRSFKGLTIFCCNLLLIAGAGSSAMLGQDVAGPVHPPAAAHAAVLGRGLDKMMTMYERASPNLVGVMKPHVTSRMGEPMVDILLRPGMSVEQALPKLKAAGFRVQTVTKLAPRMVEGYLPFSSVRSVQQVEGAQAILAIHRPKHSAGSVQSQAVAFEKADLAQARGYDGTGITIGALSDSYDACSYCSTSAEDDVATGDLPPDVFVYADLPYGDGTDEGRAMLQLIHDVAPGASLYFATADFGELDFAANILSLRAYGADIVVDDVYYYDEPMYSDGILAQAVNIVAQNGGAYFSSAGNNGLQTYEDVYRPMSIADGQKLVNAGKENVNLASLAAAGIYPKSIQSFKNADGSVSITQKVTTAGDNVVDFQWDEPFHLGKVATDYNIYVFDSAGNLIDPLTYPYVFYTTDDNTQTDEAFEFVELLPVPGDIHGGANSTTYQYIIAKMNDGTANHLKAITENGLAESRQQDAPSVAGHASASGAQAVAAMYYAIPQFPEDFSSHGPVTIYFDTEGNKLATPDVRKVPQITGADGVDTTFFGEDTDGDGYPNFFGTSAAAPDVAAVAALALQYAGGSGSLLPPALYAKLQNTATQVAVSSTRALAAGTAGPVIFKAQGYDWVRFGQYFTVKVGPDTDHSVTSITFNVSGPSLDFSLNPNRFNIGTTSGISSSDISFTVSPDQKTFTLSFPPGKFVAGDSFTFGMSVFNPLQGSTEEDPDRFGGSIITATLDNHLTLKGTIYAQPKQLVNLYTGAGLVNADLATQP